MSSYLRNSYVDNPPSYSSIQDQQKQTSFDAHSHQHATNRGTESFTGKLGDFIDKHEINSVFAQRLEKIKGYDIVVICDDSGSMRNELRDVQTSHGQAPTRWDELKRTLSVVIELAVTIDPDGIDIHFLNRPALRNIRDPRQLDATFARPPRGPTPLVPVLRKVLHENQEKIRSGKLLVLIATDGEPTDCVGSPEIEKFRRVLEKERVPIENVPVTIIACTDDDESMEYLNDWDIKIPRLDVVDDYKTEKEDIKRCQGENFPFSYGDYIVKIMMGGIDSWFDNLDEVKVEWDIRENHMNPIHGDYAQFNW